MTKCPKCESGFISGPRWIRDCYGEVLRYFCERCGYSRDEPTKDGKPHQGYQGINDPLGIIGR